VSGGWEANADRLVVDTVGVWCAGPPEDLLPSLVALAEAGCTGVCIGGPNAAETCRLAVQAVDTIESATPTEFLTELFARSHGHVAVVSAPVLVPSDPFRTAEELLGADLRSATVSFVSNDGGIASVPVRFTPVARAFDNHDRFTITDKLRAHDGRAAVPIPMADGALVVLSGDIVPMLLTHAVEGPGATMWGLLAELSLAARRRGFVNLLDLRTFVETASDLRNLDRDQLEQDRDWVLARHPFIVDLLDHEQDARDSALAIGLRSVRVGVEGMRVLIDGSCLGPLEMGTQVALVSLVHALARSSEVRQLGVTIPGAVPPYARSFLTDPKIVVGRHDPAALEDVIGRADIGHRPFQPNDTFDPEAWAAACDRVVVSILDLIGYQVGAYQDDGPAWLDYRGEITKAVELVDGVTVISDDVRRHLELECLPIDGSRVFVVPLGTEHLTGAEEGRAPRVFESPALCAREFLLCLGTNYSHKNRDLAVRLRNALAERGRDLALVLAGATVPTGSSRISEAHEGVAGGNDDVIVLPDVPAEERNWLMRHTRLLVYLTSAEGFGLVPFEAARFGTPTLAVSFGPLREFGADGIHAALSWNDDDVVAAADRLLGDPAASRRQVEVVREAGSAFSWDRCASGMLMMYRTLLDGPPRRMHQERRPL